MKRLVPLLLVGSLGCGGDVPQSAAAVVTGARVDTALLSAETVGIATFTTAMVSRDLWHDVVTAPARIALDPTTTEPIGSIVEGRVTRVYVQPGDRVRPGQVLVAIHSHELMDARASLARARAAMTAATSAQRLKASVADRAERLYTLRALSVADLERARADRTDGDAQLMGAEAELERSQALVDHLVGNGPMPADYDEHWVLIRAPMDGAVTTRAVEPGNVVLVGAPLVTVSRTSRLVLVMHLPDASAVSEGAPVRFTTASGAARAGTARVTRIHPSVDTMTRTVEVHAGIQGDVTGLRAEMFATAEIAGPASGRTVVVPAAAVQLFDGDTVVIAAESRDEGLHVTAVRVRVGRTTREKVELLAGIDSGRTVIVRGAVVAKAEILKRRGSAAGGGPS